MHWVDAPGRKQFSFVSHFDCELNLIQNKVLQFALSHISIRRIVPSVWIHTTSNTSIAPRGGSSCGVVIYSSIVRAAINRYDAASVVDIGCRVVVACCGVCAAWPFEYAVTQSSVTPSLS